jgi:hypothetical protein
MEGPFQRRSRLCSGRGFSLYSLPAKRRLLFVTGLCIPKAGKLGGSRAFFVLSTRG